MTAPYPWQQTLWQQLESRLAAGRLPHAMLLTGAAGTGLEAFAEAWIARLLGAADNPHMQALLDTGAHPDRLFVGIPKDRQQIPVDSIRELIEFVNLTAQYSQRKIAIIRPAEAMNRSAANSLLKTLEEPPAQSLLILVSEQPAVLPVTIRSRCQRFDLRVEADADTLAWLQTNVTAADADLLLAISEFAPLAACELGGENGLALRDQLLKDLLALDRGRAISVKLADAWARAGTESVHLWLLRLLRDMVRCVSRGPEAMVNTDRCQQLQDLTAGRTLRQFVLYYDQVIQNYRLIKGPYSPNTNALLEEFILSWQGQAKVERT
ncbi:MAG: DNA polymerase III subunit delta' C-terminal domain-containing protein [Gammaproteobacteria bacterium]